jgi:hypothetical protein
LSFAAAIGNASGGLTVTDGSNTANLTLLGQHVTAQFTSSNDGCGGALTDVVSGCENNADGVAGRPQDHSQLAIMAE